MAAPLPSLYDVAAFAQALPAKVDKDVRRFELFFLAAQVRTVELSASPVKAAEFVKATTALAGEWISTFLSSADPRKQSIGSIWSRVTGKDPFYDLRNKTRKFARLWDMDATLIEALG